MAAPDRLYFTEDDEANALLARDPFAMLVGFALDQQITVQQAFQGPLRIKQRVGTLEPARLATTELEALLSDPRFDRLTSTGTAADTYIVQRGTDKGVGMSAVQQYLHCQDEPVAAVGDSAPDVPMLSRATRAYAPANCTAAVRALAHDGRCTVLPTSEQRGLLAAVYDLLGVHAAATTASPLTTTGSLLSELLAAPDRSRLQRVLSAINWRSL